MLKNPAFNGLGQMIAEYQSHSGAVITSTTPKVQYAYSEMASGANHSRLTSITYPSGYVLTFNYSSGLNSSISRLSSLSDSTGTLEGYKYLGLGTVVERNHPQSTLTQTYIGVTGVLDDPGDNLKGLDRFGRVQDAFWYTLTSGVPSTAVTVSEFRYSYDADGNVTMKNNIVNSSFSENYSYDGLNQLVGFSAGISNSKAYDYDSLGNFNSVTTNTGTPVTRTANKQNEITSIGGATTPAYDANGNMIGDEAGKTFVYDSWNRLVAVESGSTTLELFGYDGGLRRVTNTIGSTTTHQYYSSAWQVLEEHVSGNAVNRYIWSQVYVNAMVVRDRDTDANGTLDERFWPTQDGNWNVTSLVDGGGSVQERYAYDPYGATTVYNGSHVAQTSGTSYASVYLYQGMRFDSISGLDSANMRWYSPSLGRWTIADPAGFNGGDQNLYAFLANNTAASTDPLGLWKISRKSADSFASAVAEKGDTFAKLGARIGLDPAVFQKWVSLYGPRAGVQTVSGTLPLSSIKPDTEIACDESVYIPNTVMALWFGELNVPGKINGKSLVAWGRNVAYLKLLGFHVAEYDVHGKRDPSAAVLEMFSVLSRSKELHGVYTWGHGYEPDKDTAASGLAGGNSFSLMYRDIGMALQYKLALVHLNVCFGAFGKNSLFSGTTGSLFFGTDKVLVPVVKLPGYGSDHYLWTTIKPGDQGTDPKAPKEPPFMPLFGGSGK